MKVILTQDVAKIGRRMAVVEVPDGYAFNKLIPQKLALPATPANLKRVEAQTKKMAATAADANAVFGQVLAALKDKTVAVAAEANADGTLFEALKMQVIAEAVQSATGLMPEIAWLHVSTPIKSTGEHLVLLTHGDGQGEFTISVESK